MTKELFEQLLKRNESPKTDFKRDSYRLKKLDPDDKKSDFIKDVICIANVKGDETGYIIIGVKAYPDGSKELVGVAGQEHYDDAELQNLMGSKVDPPLEFLYQPFEFKGKSFAIITIHRSYRRPHRPIGDFGRLRKGEVWTRRGSSNVIASDIEEEEMYADRRRTPSQEIRLVEEKKKSVVESGDDFLAQSRSDEILIPDVFLNDAALLLRRGNLQASMRFCIEIITNTKYAGDLAQWISLQRMGYSMLRKSIDEHAEDFVGSKRLLNHIYSILRNNPPPEDPTLQEYHSDLLACIDEIVNISYEKQEKDLIGQAHCLVVSDVGEEIRNSIDKDIAPYILPGWVKKIVVFSEYGDDKHYIKSKGETIFIAADRARAYVRQYFEKKGIILNRPTGWWFDEPDNKASYVEYDETSHGLAVAVAYTALFLHLEIPSDVAITGELNSNGGVILVGGIEEKLSAAYYWHQPQINKVIIPKDNRNDIPDFCINQPDFEVIPVKDFEQCLNEVFGKEKIDKAVESVVGVTEYLEQLKKQCRETASIDWRLNFEEGMYIPLKVRKGVERFEEQQEISKEDDAMEIHDALNNNQYRQAVIVGHGGAGKTTLLNYIAFDLACQRLNDDYSGTVVLKNEKGEQEKPIPLYIPLPDFKDFQSLEEWIQKKIQEKYSLSESFCGWMDTAIQVGDCILLFDGYDEVTENLRRDIDDKIHTALGISKGRALTTSRMMFGLQKFGNPLALLEFNEKQIPIFVSKRFGLKKREKSQRLIQIIQEDRSLNILSRNPLLLTIITYIFDDDPENLKNRKVELYHKFSNILLEEWEAGKQLSDIHTSDKWERECLLEKIGYEFFEQKTFKKREIAKKIPKEALGLFDEIVERTGMLRRLGENFDFIHPSFQEYYAARYIIENQLYEILLGKDESWNEVKLFYCSMADSDADIENVKSMVERFLYQGVEKNNPILMLLSGRCLSVIEDRYGLLDIEDRILGALFGTYNSIKSDWMLKQQTLNVLAEIGGPKVEESFLDLMKNGDTTRQRQVLRVLPTMLDIDHRMNLLEFLETIVVSESFEINTRQAAVEAMSKIGGQCGKFLIEDALRKPELAFLHSFIVNSLEDTFDPTVIDHLKKLLREIEALNPPTDSHLKELICKVIAKNGGDGDIGLLIGKLGDDVEVRRILVEALSDNPSEASKDFISKLVDNHCEYPAIITSLGNIGDLRFIELLKIIISKRYSLNEMIASVEALANIGSPDATQVLLDFFDEIDTDVKIKIIELLCREPKFNQMLVNCLNRRNPPDIRLAAIQAISKGHCLDDKCRKSAFEEILSILNQRRPGPNPNALKIAAMAALITLKDETTNISQVLDIFNQNLNIPELRETAIRCICKIHIQGDERYYREYLPRLFYEYREYESLQMAMISELITAKTKLQGNRVIIDILASVEEKGSDNVKKIAIEAMGKLGNQKTLRLLEDMKRDENYAPFFYDIQNAIDNLKNTFM